MRAAGVRGGQLMKRGFDERKSDVTGEDEGLTGRLDGRACMLSS